MAHKKKIKSVVTVKKEKPKTILAKYTTATLTENERNQFQELLQLSNVVAKIKKSLADKQMMINNFRNVKNKIKSKEIKPPLFAKILPDVYAPYNDIKSVMETIDRNIITVETMMKIEEGQLDHRYEEYVTALIQCIAHLSQIKGKESVKTITPHRQGNISKDEKIIYEQSFDEFVKKETKK